MANIRVDLDHPIIDGETITFKAPCDCTQITGLIVYYPTLTEGSTTNESKVFTFKDAHGNDLTGIGNLFAVGAYVKAVVDTTNGYAYLQNADTNAYIENHFAKTQIVTYVGDGSTNAHTITADFEIKFIAIACDRSIGDSMFFVRGQTKYSYSNDGGTLAWNGNSVTIHGHDVYDNFNQKGINYHCFIVG